MTRPVVVDIGGQTLRLSNLEKVLYPATGFTKGEVIDYYARIAPVLLPHLADRALTRIRYPNGVEAPSFFEKSAPQGTPDWVRRVELPTSGSRGRGEPGLIEYVVVDNVATLVWLANLAAIELHTPQWRLSGHAVGRPDLLVIDLDPGPPAGLPECCLVAIAVRHRLQVDQRKAWVKTSGRKGMQLLTPISGMTSTEASSYARHIAEDLEQALPELVTSKMMKSLRPGKVFLDWSQNNAAKTTVSAYSLRAGARPTVSAPLTWTEVETGRITPLTPKQVLGRMDRHGDLLLPLL